MFVSVVVELCWSLRVLNDDVVVWKYNITVCILWMIQRFSGDIYCILCTK